MYSESVLEAVVDQSISLITRHQRIPCCGLVPSGLVGKAEVFAIHIIYYVNQHKTSVVHIAELLYLLAVRSLYIAVVALAVLNFYPVYLICTLCLSILDEGSLYAAVRRVSINIRIVHLIHYASYCRRSLTSSNPLGISLLIYRTRTGLGTQHITLIQLVITVQALHVPRHCQSITNTHALHYIVVHRIVDQVAQRAFLHLSLSLRRKT